MCEDERVRLMWIGRGLWFNLGFYQRLAEEHGAVFVWSMYLAIAADGYIRATAGLRSASSRRGSPRSRTSSECPAGPTPGT